MRLDCRVLFSPLHCVTRHSAGCRSRPFPSQNSVSRFGFFQLYVPRTVCAQFKNLLGLNHNIQRGHVPTAVSGPRSLVWRHSRVLGSGAGLRQKVAEPAHAVSIVEGDLLVLPAKRRCTRRPSTPHVAQLSASPPRRRCQAALRLLRTCERARAWASLALGLKAGRSNGSARSGGQTS